MRPPLEFLLPPEFGIELVYSFVIIVCSLMVYFGTKEIYELSSYKGIKYFRRAFLFFALAYFCRSVIKYFLFLFNFKDIMEFSPMLIGAFTLFFFVYFSSMAVFSLLYSVMWKKWNGNSKIYLFHFFAFIIALLSIVSRSMELRFGLNLILFMVVFFTVYEVYIGRTRKNKKNNLYAIYMLLFIFFLLNIIDIMIPRFLDAFKILIYLFSSGIFLLILYKVLKKTGS